MKSLKIKANELSGDGIEYLQVSFFIAGSDTGGFLLRHIPECGTVLCQVPGAALCTDRVPSRC